MSLTDKLRAALAFDITKTFPYFSPSANPTHDLDLVFRSAKEENNRLSPYHEALLELVNIGQDMSPHSDQCIGSTYPCCENQIFHRALSKLEALLNKGET